MSTDDITIPKDPRESRLQRTQRAPRPDHTDDATTAADRIEAFWQRYPNGSILTEVDEREVTIEGHDPYSVFTVRAFIRKDSGSERPDAVAHATRGENDPDEVTAQFPQETAETSAVSRALRYVGILTGAAPAPQPEPAPVERAYRVKSEHPIATARAAANLSQRTLAARMRDHGIEWSQSIVSKTESGHRELTVDEAQALDTILDTRLADSLIVGES